MFQDTARDLVAAREAAKTGDLLAAQKARREVSASRGKGTKRPFVDQGTIAKENSCMSLTKKTIHIRRDVMYRAKKNLY